MDNQTKNELIKLRKRVLSLEKKQAPMRKSIDDVVKFVAWYLEESDKIEKSNETEQMKPIGFQLYEVTQLSNLSNPVNPPSEMDEETDINQ